MFAIRKTKLEEVSPRPRRKKRKCETTSLMLIRSNYFSKTSIFKLPSSTIISHKALKDDLRLPTLDKKRHLEDEMDQFNPEKRKLVRIPIERLKPLPTDEVKRRFMLKYQF